MMKKSLSAAIMLAAATFGYAQVGINTSTPSSTLDITAKNSTGTSKNVDGLLVPRVDRERAQSMSSIPTSTLIYVNSINKGTQTGNAVNVDAVGYYYFDGNVWVKLNAGSGSGASVNIYNSDGTLTANRTVTQGDKTLTFNGTVTNAFSVDDNTFSVDAANDRVGVGTNAPQHKFHVVANTSNLNRFSLIDAPSSTNGHPILALRNTSPSATGNFSLLGFTNSGPTSGGANWGIGSVLREDRKEDFFFGNSLGAGYLERMRISAEGKIGIGTTAPTNTLHVKAATDPLKLEGIQKGSGTTLVIDENGVVKKENVVTSKMVLVVKRNTDFNGAAGAANAVPWDGEVYDPENAFTPSASATTYTVTKAGLHQIYLNITAKGDSSFAQGDPWFARIWKNGAVIAASDATKAFGASTVVVAVDTFAAGDQIAVDFGNKPNGVVKDLTKLSIFRFE
ncbi:hypothetical protein [Chryseobacterium sp. IHB B 17019]|jgi:hypothetical protein|uniref:hypothetical protein n=1 Tax=Chryseobacterium sp. IHB B 17019 TaxID=1721091 RepID=UPI000784939D|nr:hypothetical protein [Chryseobacterium sp. IHB B 17019]